MAKEIGGWLSGIWLIDPEWSEQKKIEIHVMRFVDDGGNYFGTYNWCGVATLGFECVVRYWFGLFEDVHGSYEPASSLKLYGVNSWWASFA
jgi:hypothetical protein